MVRAKFHCRSVEKVNDTPEGYCVTMFAVYEGSEENKRFFELTPCGTLELKVVQKETAEMFKEGKEYYLDFSLAGE